MEKACYTSHFDAAVRFYVKLADPRSEREFTILGVVDSSGFPMRQDHSQGIRGHLVTV